MIFGQACLYKVLHPIVGVDDISRCVIVGGCSMLCMMVGDGSQMWLTIWHKVIDIGNENMHLTDKQKTNKGNG